MTNRVVKKWAVAHKVEIYIAGDLAEATAICQDYCNKVGLCVTIEPTNYVFTGGQEMGVRVGLINYPRFPTSRLALLEKARLLGLELKHRLEQGSYTIQDDKGAYFYSTRDCDQ